MAETSSPTALWSALEDWLPKPFLVAGGLLLGYAGLRGVEMVTGATFQTAFMTGYGLVAVAPAVVGLLGLYPRLYDRTPRLSLAGLGATLVAVVGIVALLSWLLGATLLMARYPEVPDDAPAWTAAALVVVFLSLAVAFLLFGVASLRSTVFSRRVGLLLLIPAVMWVGFIVGTAVAPAGHYLSVLVYTPMAAAFVALWHRLRTESEPPDQSDPAPTEVRHG